MSPVGRFGGGSRLANSSRTALAEWSGSLGAIYWHFSPSTVQTDHSAAATNSLVKTAVYGLSGMLSSRKSPIFAISEFPNVIPCPFRSGPDLRGPPESKPMKPTPPPPTPSPVTLQTVLDRLPLKPATLGKPQARLALGDPQLRKLRGQPPAAIPLTLPNTPDPQPKGPDAGADIAQAMGKPAQRPCPRHRGLQHASDAQDRRPRDRRGLDPLVCARRPSSARPFAFRSMGKPAPCRAGSPSTTARSTASSPNWMRRP